MDTLIKVIYSPVKVFRKMKNMEKFPAMSLIVLLIVVVINNILMIPVTTKIFELTFSSMQIPVSDDQVEKAMLMLHKMRYLTAVGAVFTYCFTLVVYTLIIWVFTKIAKLSLSFSKAFELIIHCCFILVIGSLVNTFILYYQGIENITNIYKISLTGLNLLTSTEQVGVTFYTFLSLINPFYIWFLFLLTLGLATLADVKFSKAFFPCFLFWIIIIVFPVVTIYFSQMIMQRSGLVM